MEKVYHKGLTEENGEGESLKKNSKSFKFLTYNIFLRPPLINNNGHDYKDLRYKLFIEKFLKKYDFINFQELFGNFNSRKGNMIKEAKNLGFKWSAKSPKPPMFSPFFIDWDY